MNKSNPDIEATLELQSLVDSNVFTPGQAEGMQLNIDEMNAVVSTFVGAVEKAAESGHYSQPGLSEFASKQRAQALAKLDELGKKAIDLAEYRLKLETNSLVNHPPAGSGDEAYDAGLEREVRDYLRGLDPLIREQLYLESASTGDDPTIERAVERSPKIFNLVRPEILQQGRAARLERMNPTAFKEIHKLNEWIRVGKGYLNRARTQITKYSSHAI